MEKGQVAAKFPAVIELQPGFGAWVAAPAVIPAIGAISDWNSVGTAGAGEAAGSGAGDG